MISCCIKIALLRCGRNITDTQVSKNRTLTNNEIKDVMKVIKSLDNREILLKENNRKITSQEGRFLNFFRPLITTGLPLMENFLAPLARRVLLPFALTA